DEEARPRGARVSGPLSSAYCQPRPNCRPSVGTSTRTFRRECAVCLEIARTFRTSRSDMGDKDFTRLYSEHAQPLYAFLSYRTGDRVLAEDLLADKFERVLHARNGFDRRKASE